MKKLVKIEIEKILEKTENAGNQHFLLSPQSSHTKFFLQTLEMQDCLVKGKQTVYIDHLHIGIFLRPNHLNVVK